MIDITEPDGCREFDEHVMEASIVGFASPELDAHLESCSRCAVAMANYQLAARAIRGSEVSLESTWAANHSENADIARRPGPRILGPRTLIALASIAAALLALVHFGSTPNSNAGERLVVRGSGDPGTTGETSANTLLVSTQTPTGNGTADPGPRVDANGGQALPIDNARETLECIDVGGKCFCCVGCDIQTLVGNDLPEHRIPAALHGLKIGDRVTSSTLPSGGFIVDERSSLL